MDMDDYKEEDTTLPPNQINTIDLFQPSRHVRKEKNRQPVETTVASDDVSIEEKSPLFQSVCVKYRKGRQCRLILSSILIPNKKL